MALLANIARASALTLLCGLPAGAQDVADRIFTGGTIVIWTTPIPAPRPSP